MASAAPSRRAPIAPKTQAAGLAGAVAGAIIYILQTYVFKGTVNAGLVGLIYAAVPGALAFAAAYLAPHQVRPTDPVISTLPPPPATNPGGTA